MVDFEEVADEAPAGSGEAPSQPVTSGTFDKQLGDLLIAHEGNSSALMDTVLEFLARRSNVFQDEAAEKRLLGSVRRAGKKSREDASAARAVEAAAAAAAATPKAPPATEKAEPSKTPPSQVRDVPYTGAMS
jgi:hypothetical protein